MITQLRTFRENIFWRPTLFLKRTDPDYEISDPRVPVCMTNVGLGVVDVV